jgi:hypothetical protein
MVRFGLLTILAFFSRQALSYPEYAVRYGMMRCTACHWQPAGGGPRTVNGKAFGAHGLKINPFLLQDYVSGDFRLLYDYPEKPAQSKGGAGVMMGSVAGHLALDEAKRVHVVIEENVAGFQQASARDTYALFQFAPEDGQAHGFDSLLLGRFRAPFGLVTDEHRTYTRVQSISEFYSYDTGAMLSGTPTNSLHYDVAALSGDRNSGTSLGNGVAERWGAVGNLRWMPGALLLGTSYKYSSLEPARNSREAVSLYAILSLVRWTAERVPLSIRVEHVRARNFDDHLGEGFAADANYVATLKNARSQGWLAWFDYEIQPRLTLIYKYESLMPDQDFRGDVYERHGLGVRWVIAPETLIQARYEKARATPPSESGRSSEGAQDATYAILQLSF